MPSVSYKTVFSSPFIIWGEKTVLFNKQQLWPVYQTDLNQLFLLTEKAKGELLSGHFASQAQISKFLSMGLLTNDPVKDRIRVRDSFKRDNLDASRRTFVLFVCSDCNMDCSYCGQIHKRVKGISDWETKVMRRIENVTTSKNTRSITVKWFGGEPLLGYRHIIQMGSRLYEICRETGIDYSSSVTTNGSLMTSRRVNELSRTAHVNSICVTLDGPAEQHDLSRHLKTGGHSFERILDVVSNAIREENPIQWVLRTNVTPQLSPHISEYLNTLAEMGLTNCDRVILDIAPVHEWAGNESSNSHKWYESQEIAWLKQATDLGFSMDLLSSGETLPCVALRRGGECIDSFGTVFSCPEYPLTKTEALHRLGNIPAKSDFRPVDKIINDNWLRKMSLHESRCFECALLPVCAGGCSLGRKNPCPSFKTNIAQRVSLAARQLVKAM
ncbi:radical SAM/SPASM domain-containing protein [Bifidobacterium sp.]|jgi:uncharacterized protein|uniref:radical SAM/SPASM domain-containing protein n=1 Tax=Bifidobacterium sp. TaxID=41200 RepID=UPI0025B9BD6E|nr:radical SAM protein [Bifidobacterium sp.]MCH4208974.1 radical SAM protein [Bifidobacterium sp.]MCI1224943.1 radical SAM protein [Bifidobacterium sp.]